MDFENEAEEGKLIEMEAPLPDNHGETGDVPVDVQVNDKPQNSIVYQNRGETEESSHELEDNTRQYIEETSPKKTFTNRESSLSTGFTEEEGMPKENDVLPN